MEKERNHSKLQAIKMSGDAGVFLREGQIKDYVSAREDEYFNPLSDQVLLDLTLDKEQGIVFRARFRNIKF